MERKVIATLALIPAGLTIGFNGAMTAQSGKTPDEPAIVSLQPVRALTDDSSWFDTWPGFSPDGKEIVFSRTPVTGERSARLWRMPADGGPPHPLTPIAFDRHCTRPDWSLDGKTIAFRAGRGTPLKPMNPFTNDAPGAIWLFTVATGEMRPLTDERKYDDYYPHWSPDGRWIFISRNDIYRSKQWDIWRISLHGAEERLTSHPSYDVYGVPSPDGKLFSFNSDRDGNRNVWIIDLGKGEKEATQFTFSGGRGAMWSPDGQWIAFHPPPSVMNGSIYIKRVNGGPRIQITECTGENVQGHPHWSPDGKYILFDEVDPNPQRASRGHLKVVDVSKIVGRQ